MARSYKTQTRELKREIEQQPFGVVEMARIDARGFGECQK